MRQDVYYFDYKSNLEKMRKNFTSSLFVNERLPKPKWLLSNKNDTLNQIYADSRQLFKCGGIYYAQIVQANEILFKSKPPFDCPANIVIGESDYYDENPIALKKIARELFSYKNTDNVPAELKIITDSITSELDRLYNIALPNNQAVYFSTIMVFRKHLPGRRLVNSLIPVLTNPQMLQSTIILPKRYWTKEFTRIFTGEF